MEGLILFLLAGLSFSFVHCQDVVLNAPQVLLPYTAKRTSPVTYILRANKGCFKWYINHFDFLHLKTFLWLFL